MAEVGLLAPDARVELIEGVIIDMASPGTEHCAVVDILTESFVLAVTGKAIVRVGGPVRLSQWSEPKPDLTVLRLRQDWYGNEPPGPRDTCLMVEVADSSLRYDLDTKSKLYARHGVEDLWIIDVNRQTLHAFSGRTDVGYTNAGVTTQLGVIKVPSLDATIDLSTLFG
jgi:Uma2 family endonuclease